MHSRKINPLVLIALVATWSVAARADMYLDEPEGGEVFISGETLHISWMTVPGDEPNGEWAELYYIWAGTSERNYITSFTDPGSFNNGSYDWTVPTVAETSYLAVEVCGSTDGSSCLTSDRSLNITILPSADTPSIFLSDPRPAEEDVIVLQGGSTHTIRWEVTGCSAATDDIPMTIRFSPTGMPGDWTDQGTALPCQQSSFAWDVPDIETSNGHIRLDWSDLDWSGHNTPFSITADPDPNYPPVADAGADQTVPERAEVTLDGTASHDPNGDYLSYHWERVDAWTEYDITIAWEYSREASFIAPEIDLEQITFVFRLTVEDPEGLQDFDTVAITVTGSGPALENLSPLEGWYKTPVTLEGADLRACEVYLGGQLVTTIPDRPDADSGTTFILPDLEPGPATVRVECPAGEAITYWQDFLVLRVPYQWDWGFKFHNPGDYLMSWQDLENCFGHDATHMLLCCEWDDLVCERRCHDPLMQLVYEYYARELAWEGSCWGMSAASSKYAMGALDLPAGQQVRDYSFELEPNETTMATTVKYHHISQVSAEVIGFLLDHLGDDPLDIVDRIDEDTRAGRHGVISINNMTAGSSPLSLSGHALVPDRVIQVSDDTWRIYVYDPNVESFSVCRDSVDVDDYGRITTQEEYPYIQVEERTSGTRAWSFEMAGGTLWGGDDRYHINTSFGEMPFYGLTYYPPEMVDGPYTAPLSLEGILMILGTDTDAAIQDEEGRLTGTDGEGALHLEIPDAIPVLPVAAGSGAPGQMFVLPADAYQVAIHGRAQGSYTFSTINQGRLLAVRDADMDTDTSDTLDVDPVGGSLALSTSDAGKDYEVVIVELVEQGGKQLQRTFEILDGLLEDAERVEFATTGDRESLTISNQGTRDMQFTVRLTQAALGPQPEPPDYPDVADHTLTETVVVPAGKKGSLTPSDWDHLGQATAALEIDDDPGPDPDPDDGSSDGGCGCGTRGTTGGLAWIWVLSLCLLVTRRRLT